jgi:hypothetical protein
MATAEIAMHTKHYLFKDPVFCHNMKTWLFHSNNTAIYRHYQYDSCIKHTKKHLKQYIAKCNLYLQTFLQPFNSCTQFELQAILALPTVRTTSRLETFLY